MIGSPEFPSAFNRDQEDTAGAAAQPAASAVSGGERALIVGATRSPAASPERIGREPTLETGRAIDKLMI
jgi:hypothetical protein